jgi:phosphonopyruvate decarboxylase
MLTTNEFGRFLREFGYNFYSGVPCSFLKSLINYAISKANYVAAANEGDAVATCFGATLGGAKSVVLMQNSGLTNAVSPLTSLNYPFRVPVLGFVSLRGEPGTKDEPQHELMGTITTRLLEEMRISWAYLSVDPSKARAQLRQADAMIERGRPFFFVVRKNVFGPYPLRNQPRRQPRNELHTPPRGNDEMPRREAVLRHLNDLRRNNTVFLATTGVTGRELYKVANVPGNLYMVGSMGCIGSIALGLAMQRPDLEVIALDGDGALLMRMGSLSTIAAYSPPNMLHVVLDNNVHESTGEQLTASHHVSFSEIAASCGFARSVYVHSCEELGKIFEHWRAEPCLTLAHIRIAAGHDEPLPRPSEHPSFMARRFMSYIGQAPLPISDNDRLIAGERRILFTPGPAGTEDRVKRAMMIPDISPRTAEFQTVLVEISRAITAIAADSDSHDTVLLSGSGTAAVEAMLSSVGAAGRRILIIDNGAYGHRMAEIARAHQLNFETFVSNPCRPIDLDQLNAALGADGEPFARLAVVHHETTTGLLNDLTPLGELAGRHGARLLVDAMSSFAALPIDMKAMNIAFLAASANKNLQGMPGVSFVVCERVELQALADHRPSGYYLDLYAENAYFRAHGQTRFTAPVQTLYALREALSSFRAEGQANRCNRYQTCSRTLLDGLERLGFISLVHPDHQAGLILSVVPPEGPAFDFQVMDAYFQSHGITIYQGKLEKVRYLRLATIGTIDMEDINYFLDLLEAYCAAVREPLAAV